MKRILTALKNNKTILLIENDNEKDIFNLFICKDWYETYEVKYENIKLAEAFLIIERDYGVKELFEVNSFLEAVNKEKNIRLVIEEGKKEWEYCLDVIDLKTGKSFNDWHCETMEEVYAQAEDYGVVPEDFKAIDFSKLKPENC